jgi:hypothetical protein
VNPADRVPDIDYHLELLVEGAIDGKDLARLESAILEDPEVRDYCIDYLHACAALRRSSLATGELSETDIMAAISGGPVADRVRPLKGGLWSCAAAAAALIAVAAWMAWSLWPQAAAGPSVGRLVDVRQAVWPAGHGRLAPGRALRPDLLQLQEGLARIEMGRGAEVVVQAPCVFRLDGTNELTLISGRLVASVGPLVRGFVVHTKAATVTDLGTEFAVFADGQDRVEAHVFQGRVMVEPGPGSADRSGVLSLEAGQAAAVDADGQTDQAMSHAQASRFVRSMPKEGLLSCPGRRLDLADLVGGGNGFGTGVRGQGIDLVTGRSFNRPIRIVRQTLQTGYTPVRGQTAIDGVFVPNGGRGRVVISSTGLVFPGCPVTRSTYYEGVVNTALQTVVDQPDTTYPGLLKGVEYGTSQHPGLNIHPNAGITFDLDVIRAENPGIRVERFMALAGVSQSTPRRRASAADFWVLVDGKVTFHFSCPLDQNRAQEVAVPLSPESRFLTLATTCTEDAGYSWCFFGDPVLGLSAEQQTK